MSNPSAILILNCRSGDGDMGKIAQELRSLADTLGVTCDIVRARTAVQVIRAARKAAKSSYDVVIAGGGDGTINAVASELVGTGKRLGVLPLGTFNYFAREIGLPTDLEAAFRACFEGEVRPVSVGEVNGRIFLNNASIGLYPFILSVREQTYRRWGRSRVAAYWSVLRALVRLRLNLKLTITANGERRIVRTPVLFVARNAVQLQEFQVPGTRCVSEDGFSVYMLRPKDKLRLLLTAWRVFARKLEPHYDYEMFCASEIRVESRRILRTLAFDGERAKMLAPLEFHVREHALGVMVPKTRKEESVA